LQPIRRVCMHSKAFRLLLAPTLVQVLILILLLLL
jgi:hypothetical protein